MKDFGELQMLIKDGSPNIHRWTSQGFDVMTCVAAEVLEKEPGDITVEERQGIKTLAFPLLYGTDVTDLSEKEARV